MSKHYSYHDFLHSIQAKTNVFYSNPFHSDQTRLLPFQAIPVRLTTIFSIPSYSSQAKTNVLHSKRFQSGQNPHPSVQNRLPAFQTIPVRPKPTSSIPCYVRPILSINILSSPCLVAAGYQTIQFLFPATCFNYCTNN
jgi:hypothetical protein